MCNKKTMIRVICMTMLFAMTAGMVAGCSETQVDSANPYVSVAGQVADASFLFEIGAKEASKIYPESTGGTTYYVSQSGKSSNDGKSEDSPLKEIIDINKLDLNPGDRVLFKEGETFEGCLKITSSGTDDNPIYIGSYGPNGGRAILKSTNKVTVYLEWVSNVVVENLEIIAEGPVRNTGDSNSGTGIKINCESATEQFRNIYILNNVVHGNGYRNETRGIHIVAHHKWGVDGSSVPADQLVNCYVMYNEVYNFGEVGIEVQSWCLDYNLTGTATEVFRNVHVDHNIIHDIGQIGAYLNCCTDSSLDRNLVYRCGVNDTGLVSVGDTGIMTMSCKDCSMNYNVIYETEAAGMTYDGMGLDIDWNCDNIEVRFNHCYNNAGAGIATMANSNCVIADNRIENNRCEGNQKSQLQITDFTATYKTLDSDTFVVRNLLIEDNLIINDLYNHYAMERTGEGVISWLQKRVIPKNRTFVDEILKTLGLSHNDTKGIIDVCKGLSLNDSYWVVPEGFTGTFAHYNLYENRFSEMLALVAYTGAGQSRQAFTTSPELTTSGMLPKAWRFIEHDGIYLYKGGTSGASNAGREPYCEYYACQIAEAMKLNAVHYDLENWKGITASRCALFTDIDTSFIPIGRIVRTGGIQACLNYYDSLGKEFSEQIRSMLVFDAVIYNEDRHFGNFGVLRDNHTGKIIAPAPIFDNGLSLFCFAGAGDIPDLTEYAGTRATPYNLSYYEICAEVMGAKQKAQLRRLIGFKFKRHSYLNLPEEHLQSIERTLERRVRELLAIPTRAK